MQQLFLGTGGAVAKKTYIDDIFSPYLWKGDGNSGRPIINGIKLSNANAGNSVQFDASSSQYLKVPQHSSLELGTGDYCIECWVRPTRSSTNEGIWTYGSYDGNGGMLAWIHGNTLKIFCARTNANICDVNNWRQQNVWTHLAVTRYSGTTKTFSNGVEIATSTEQNNDNVGEAANNMNQFFLGAERNNTNNIGGFFEGNISNMRIVKGSAVYTSNFTPPTKALTSTTNTVVLFCQSSISATAATKTPIAITSSGDPTIIGFGPFTATDGEGGLVWMKSRSTGHVNVLFDTERGANQRLRSDSNLGQNNTDTLQPSFTNSGFTVGSGNEVNGSGNDYTSWTFRKAPGFFDVVTYTGNGSNRTISHSLGCVPGCYMIKRTDTSTDWKVFHRSLKGKNWYLELNTTDQQYDMGDLAPTAPTASEFSVGTDSSGWVNVNGGTYVCYLFAGGESTQNEAVSVDFDGTNDYLSIPDSSDFTVGTNYTAECWFYTDAIGSAGWDGIFGQWSGNNNAATNSWVLEYVGTHLRFYYINSGGTLAFKSLVDEANGEVLALKQWYHFAFVKSGSTTKLYLNGILKQSFDTTYQDGSGSFNIGGNVASGGWFNGRISNVRIVNGTAVYTSSFRPPTEPLTNITNTKLLCCNDSSQTGSTVTPGTITNNGSTASTDSPFDDPAGFVFGDSGDQNVIKNGYMKLDSSGKATVNLGFEPQWLMWKKTSATGGWTIYDAMRGVFTGSGDQFLNANANNAESTTNADVLSFTPTGFEVNLSYHSESEFIFTAIRRSDGYVGKPPELGTDVFNMGVGQNSTTIPNYISGFPVDMGMHRLSAATSSFTLISRLMGPKYLLTPSDAGEGSGSWATFDSNTGYITNQQDNTHQAWMWKRHAGFDVTTITDYDSDTGPTYTWHPHSLGKKPEMIWVKRRDSSQEWWVYHHGANGGTTPWNHYLQLQSNAGEGSLTGFFGESGPTATHFSLKRTAMTDGDFIFMLFASVADISKVGYYNGSNSDQTITLGFQPRLFICKARDEGSADYKWTVLDSTRGLVGSSGKALFLDTSASPTENHWVTSVSSTGITLKGIKSNTNFSGREYIYYAHA